MAKSGIHRKPHKRVSTEEILKIKAALMAGEATASICKRFDISAGTFSKLKAAGFVDRRKKPRATEITDDDEIAWDSVSAPARVLEEPKFAAPDPIEISDGEWVEVQKPNSEGPIRPRQKMCVVDCADKYWPLRRDCESGENFWGNLFGKGGRGAADIALKQEAIRAITEQGGDFKSHIGFTVGAGNGGGAEIKSSPYIGHVGFGSVAEAFFYLAQYFDLCCCPNAEISLREHGVDWITLC
jgi:hypothetical protein